jgi:hypothetical protein
MSNPFYSLRKEIKQIDIGWEMELEVNQRHQNNYFTHLLESTLKACTGKEDM